MYSETYDAAESENLINKWPKVSSIASALTMAMIALMACPEAAVAAHDHEQMMLMDQSEHQHAGHEQHLAAKPGVFSRKVESYTVPEVDLVDMDGMMVNLNMELSSDTPVFLNFIFTTCTTICPVMSASFQQVQHLLGDNPDRVRLVSISIDPEQDTPTQLKQYAKRYDVGDSWKLLTGTWDNSYAVQQAFGIYAGDKMNHQPVTFMKARGSENTWVRLDGLVDATDIIKEFEKLKHE